jgi:hypothetical protein
MVMVTTTPKPGNCLLAPGFANTHFLEFQVKFGLALLHFFQQRQFLSYLELFQGAERLSFPPVLVAQPTFWQWHVVPVQQTVQAIADHRSRFYQPVAIGDHPA